MTKTVTRKKKAEAPAPAAEPQKILELGNSLELWKVHPSSLREQDVNARAMPKANHRQRHVGTQAPFHYLSYIELTVTLRA